MLASLPESVRSALQDPVTLELPEPPLVVASDGYTYNVHTLREILSHDVLKRSPRTGEMLRRTAFRAFDTEALMMMTMMMCTRAGKHVGAGAGADAGNARGPAVYALYEEQDVLESVLSVAATRMPPTLSHVVVRVPVDQLLASPKCVRLLKWANFVRDGECPGSIAVHLVVSTKRKQKPVVQSAPPVVDLIAYGREFAECANMDMMFADAYRVLTCKLEDGTTLESRVLKHRYPQRT